MRRFLIFVLLGPPLGAMFALLAESHGSNVGQAIVVGLMTTPLSYLFGGVPALGTAIIASATARYLNITARVIVAAYAGGVLTMIYVAVIGFYELKLPAIGALSALGCSSLIEYLEARTLSISPERAPP